MARSTPTETAEILAIKQVAVYLQVAVRTIYQIAAADDIPAIECSSGET